MTEPTNLGELIRARLTQDELDRLQHFDPAALRALDRAIIDTPMADGWRNNLRTLIQHALDGLRHE
jgi:hypothetical protein